jgi:hypothetical protein
VGGSETSYLTDGCTYTIHIKGQGKEAVNWMVLGLLK